MFGSLNGESYFMFLLSAEKLRMEEEVNVVFHKYIFLFSKAFFGCHLLIFRLFKMLNILLIAMSDCKHRIFM